jgi:hypothetical protein
MKKVWIGLFVCAFAVLIFSGCAEFVARLTPENIEAIREGVKEGASQTLDVVLEGELGFSEEQARKIAEAAAVAATTGLNIVSPIDLSGTAPLISSVIVSILGTLGLVNYRKKLLKTTPPAE